MRLTWQTHGVGIRYPQPEAFRLSLSALPALSGDMILYNSLTIWLCLARNPYRRAPSLAGALSELPRVQDTLRILRSYVKYPPIFELPPIFEIPPDFQSSGRFWAGFWKSADFQSSGRFWADFWKSADFQSSGRFWADFWKSADFQSSGRFWADF